MELIDIIVTALSIVLIVLLVILIASFIIYKFRRNDDNSNLNNIISDSFDEKLNSFQKEASEQKNPRFKVLNDNLHFHGSSSPSSRSNTNRRFVVYNYVPVKDFSIERRRKN